ncbi:unnamed protein product [Nyctereutes procyonoides]|uniref:(2E,6E)-farnesyl diphosphate synthase n=1 Tax=Nyctereutes procyonoides TaxID=34880 RepID=A0A811YBX6_NYCPR|nr:unnamed protein product [Nyctereutes procyonoides]
MDSSLTRWGQICWYQNPGIGLDAINNVLLLEAFIYSSYQIEIEQILGLITGPQGNYKIAFYSFYLPEEKHANAKKILLEMGKDPSVTGKIDRGIQDNKCSWLGVQYLQWELTLPAVFMQYEEDKFGV